jgi:hypothetical protein
MFLYVVPRIGAFMEPVTVGMEPVEVIYPMAT